MKSIFITSIAGLLLLSGLFFFGKIDPVKKNITTPVEVKNTFTPSGFIQKAKQNLPASQLVFLNKLENNITRGDLKTQSLNSLRQIADFWKDSVKLFVPYAYYTAEAAKLDNSEKSLTFAARLFLDNMRGESDEALKSWEAETAVSFFEKAIQLDPDNDSLKVGLGSCYIYGKGITGDATETMKGIQQLLQVVRKDSANMQAQMVLGIGGVISRQYDKGIERLIKVVNAEPANLEAVSWLADAYAATGDNANAIKWYQYSKKIVNSSEYNKEVDKRIEALGSNASSQ